ncbi:hypothetical protein CLU95_0126 [Variovorax sp. 54]|nr:hypothetical protein CLU95_0126 [Variovorax sp. 54]
MAGTNSDAGSQVSSGRYQHACSSAPRNAPVRVQCRGSKWAVICREASASRRISDVKAGCACCDGAAVRRRSSTLQRPRAMACAADTIVTMVHGFAMTESTRAPRARA